MRKRQISSNPPSAPPSAPTWLDIERTALVEVTSEEKGFPIEAALLGGENQGWRAAYPGTQTIRLIFDEPQYLRRIWLEFKDSENARTQECYAVELSDVTVLELIIAPDKSGGAARASLASLCLA